MGIRALTRFRLAAHMTSCTAVAVDILLQAEGSMKDDQERVFLFRVAQFPFPTALSYVRKEGP